MSIQIEDMVFRKAQRATDTGTNGGRKGAERVVPGARHNLFPRVTRSEREAGLTRYRKQFFVNEHAESDSAWGVLLFLEHPSTADDAFAMAMGTQRDDQAQLLTSASPPTWLGVGRLHTDLAGGETSVSLDMEDADTVFENGGFLHLSNRFAVQQTMDSPVRPGDTVHEDGGVWRGVDPIATGGDIVHPYGIFLGNDTVLTATAASREEWLRIAERLHEDEVLATGDGLQFSPALAPLQQAADGICSIAGKTPVVTAVSAGVPATVVVGPDGQCSGDCTGGELEMATGAWTTPISWNSPPDAGTDIRITYRERCFRKDGETFTILLDEQVAGAYSTANTFGGGCLHVEELKAESDGWSISSAAGEYDHAAHPLTIPHNGAAEETWTLTFTSPTSFACAGVEEGEVGVGTVAAPFSPLNPHAGAPYFVLYPAGFQGIFAPGDRIIFSTHPAAVPIWMRQTVPAGVAEATHNCTVLGWYCE